MVSTANLAAIIINIVICFGIPIGGVIVLLAAGKKPMAPVLSGAAVFFVFQLVLRIPLLQTVLPPMEWYSHLASRPWAYGVFLALTAGIFEEFGRLIGFKTLLRRRAKWIDGVAFGIGHGGIEAIALVGLANINNLIFALSINRGSYESLSAGMPAGLAETIRLQLTGMPPQMFLMGGLERIFAVTIQIALSVLVLYAVTRRRLRFVFLAVLLHMLIDAPVVILPAYFPVNAYQLELFVGAAAVFAFIFTVKSQRLFDKESPLQAD